MPLHIPKKPLPLPKENIIDMEDILILDKTGTRLIGVNIELIESTGMTVTSIDLPEGLTEIGKGSFISCTLLKHIDIPESVRTIEYCAFDGCTSLRNIDLPEKITRIADYAFADCKSLKSIDLPKGLIEMEDDAFYGCTLLKSIVLPEGLKKIGDFVFQGCKSLKSIHSAITDLENIEVGDCAFSGINMNKCTLYVPHGKRWAYRHHPVFGKFKKIETE